MGTDRRDHASDPLCALLALFAQSVLVPAAGQHAIDGDTLLLGGKRYRLHGIDAPDPAQICGDGWPAGHEAEAYRGELIAGRAFAWVPHSARYVAQEAAAEAVRRGLHGRTAATGAGC